MAAGTYLKKSDGTWGKVTKFFVKKSDGTWASIKNAWVKISDGTWKSIFAEGGPEIDAPVIISSGSWYIDNGGGRVDLYGSNGTWTYAEDPNGTITQTYEFQKSNDGVTWTSIGADAIIGGSGSIVDNQTVTCTIHESAFTQETKYYRFEVKAVAAIDNTEGTSTSTQVNVTIPDPTDVVMNYVSAVGSNGSYPSVNVSSGGGIESFSFSWDTLSGVDYLVAKYTRSDTGQTITIGTYSTPGSVNPSIPTSSNVNVSPFVEAYGALGSGGYFTASWQDSFYADKFSVAVG